MEQNIAIYCICDELLKSFGWFDDLQCKMTTAEVMSFALISALHYKGDYRLTRLVSISCKYFRNMLSHSRIVRRIHSIPEILWWLVFKSLQIYLRKSNSQTFIVDSLPIKAYDNHKSFRAKIFRGKEYHGYSASRKQYFFGLKIHMIIDAEGIPIEFCFTPGSFSDIRGLKELPCELPEGSGIFGDKAYTDYSLEDDLLEMVKVNLISLRKKQHRRQNLPEVEYILKKTRNNIETVFSSIVSRMPRHIRAATETGFYIKLFLFILAYLLNKSFPEVYSLEE